MELIQGSLGSLGVLVSLIYSVFCWFGGRDVNVLGIRNRIWGRLIAPIFLSLAVCGLAIISHHFNYWMLLSTPAYIGSHHMGYGGDSIWKKILRRSLWSTLRTASSLTFVLFTGKWSLFILQATLGLLSANVLGVRNPLEAPQEDGLINFCSAAFVPFMVL